jgi:outer membrane autotransporter protein
VWQDGFTEHGAGTLDLSVRSQNRTSTRSVAGIRTSHILPLGSLQLATDLRFGWDHELAGTGHDSVASFAGTPDSAFTIDGVRAPCDSAEVGFGVATSVGRGVSVYLHYDGQFGGVFSNAATGGLRYTWQHPAAVRISRRQYSEVDKSNRRNEILP